MRRLLVCRRRTADKPHSLGVLVGSTRSREEATRKEHFTLDLLDLDAGETKPARIALDFFGHGLAVCPRRSREGALFEKRGRGGCTIDLLERRIMRSIAPMPGHIFYGHAAYSQGGDALFVVETDLESNQGAVSIRDATTCAVLGTIPTYGMAPHDCCLVEDGRTLVVTNGGGPIGSSLLPSVSFVDVKTHTLLEKHEVGDLNRNAGHVAVALNREFAAVSAPRDGLPPLTSLGGVSLRRRNQPWIHMTAPQAVASRLVGESLSVAIHRPSRMVLATHPDGNLITFWSLDGCALMGSLELPGPRGVAVTLDERFFVVSYANDARLLLIQAQPIKVLADRELPRGAFGGAHLYTWAL